MGQWIDKIIGRADDLPSVHQEEQGPIRVQVMEYKKPCGHPGYLVEVFLQVRTPEEWSQIGCFGWEDLQVVIEMMQSASDTIAARTGHRPLPTVRLWNKTFYVDEKLRMLRNIEDPHDFIELK